jgi:60 kDa SS-A/Ro ribonucleoprotein
MRFNFSQKGRQPANTRYAYMKGGLPEGQWNLFKTLLSGSLITSPDRHETADLHFLRKEVQTTDRAFIARLTVYFSEQKDFRTLAFLLSAELAAIAGNEPETGILVAQVIRTPMDIPLWLEYFARATKPGRKPGRAIRRHLAVLFNKLDEYQYSRSGRRSQLALRDALRWLGPKAADRTKKTLFTTIARDQIRVRTTWEQEFHALYRQPYDSPEQRQVILREKWNEGISSFRIGYTPLQDNLRPMLCAGVSGKVLKLAAEYLGNASAVKRSGVDPLRLLGIYRGLLRVGQGGAGMLTEALEKAVLHSSWTELELGSNGVSLIAMDVSNSMKRPLHNSGGAQPDCGQSTGTASAQPGNAQTRGTGNAQPTRESSVQRFDVAPLLASLWKSRGDQLITGIIGNTWRPFEPTARPVLMSTDEFRKHEGEAGYAINAWLIFQDLLRKRQVVDRVMIFTDYRLWDNRSFNQTAGTDLRKWWRLYREQLAPEAKLYLFDLAGYGARSLEYLGDGVCQIAGWNGKIFEVLDILNRDPELILAE